MHHSRPRGEHAHQGCNADSQRHRVAARGARPAAPASDSQRPRRGRVRDRRRLGLWTRDRDIDLGLARAILACSREANPCLGGSFPQARGPRPSRPMPAGELFPAGARSTTLARPASPAGALLFVLLFFFVFCFCAFAGPRLPRLAPAPAAPVLCFSFCFFSMQLAPRRHQGLQ